MSVSDYEIALRLLLACILGGIVGWEREKIHKPAGLRTHILVALGAALLTTISMYAFLAFDTVNKDPARIAANIVTGIGFLGAGTIMREGPSVKGLTTAASIWAVAAIGMAVGSGMYISALVATLLVFITLEGVIEKILFRNKKSLQLNICNEFMLEKVGDILKQHDISIKHVSVLPINHSKEIPVEFRLNIAKKTKIAQVIKEIEQLDGVTIAQSQKNICGENNFNA